MLIAIHGLKLCTQCYRRDMGTPEDGHVSGNAFSLCHSVYEWSVAL